jgi:hypothetical protein
MDKKTLVDKQQRHRRRRRKRKEDDEEDCFEIIGRERERGL